MRKVWQDTNDACFRASVAMVLDLDYREVPYIPPGGNRSFWAEWIDWLISEKKCNLSFFQVDQKSDWPIGPWIAVVDARPTSPVIAHAIVMNGDKLFHDPTRAEPRTRTPQKIHFGIELRRNE